MFHLKVVKENYFILPIRMCEMNELCATACRQVIAIDHLLPMNDLALSSNDSECYVHINILIGLDNYWG